MSDTLLRLQNVIGVYKSCLVFDESLKTHARLLGNRLQTSPNQKLCRSSDEVVCSCLPATIPCADVPKLWIINTQQNTTTLSLWSTLTCEDSLSLVEDTTGGRIVIVLSQVKITSYKYVMWSTWRLLCKSSMTTEQHRNEFNVYLYYETVTLNLLFSPFYAPYFTKATTKTVLCQAKWIYVLIYVSSS